MTLLTDPPSIDGVIATATVQPLHNGNPEYVGVLQWCSGPNVPVKPGEYESVAFCIVATKSRRVLEHQRFYFRAVKHTLSLRAVHKRHGDKAVLEAFNKLCHNNKIVMAFDTPFFDLMECPEFSVAVVAKITEQFNLLHEGQPS
jgi:hypothetical protein